MTGICTFFLIVLSLFWAGQAQAGVLSERLAKFPEWDTKPPVQAVIGMEDLIYPNWMAGTWNVTSTLVDLVAPLAPEIVTPGFENNHRYLNQPITFTVRFPEVNQNNFAFTILNPKSKILSWKGRHRDGNRQDADFPQNPKSHTPVVADRSFNGFNIAKAVLGDRAVLSVKTDPHNPNRQTTLLSGSLQLVSIVTSRASEMPNPNEFVSTEITQQLFRATNIGMRPYFNEVETTTAYRKLETSGASIEADQVTAIYLSPQDPNYFVAADKPVALYRYRLEFFPASVPGG